MKVLPFGYAAKGAKERFMQLMCYEPWIVADIRLHPVSRFHPTFTKNGLQSIFKGRYVHIPELGNLNYKLEDRHKGIQLAHPDMGIARLQRMLNYGNNLIILCACANFDTCHRKVVVELVKQVLPDVEVEG